MCEFIDPAGECGPLDCSIESFLPSLNVFMMRSQTTLTATLSALFSMIRAADLQA